MTIEELLTALQAFPSYPVIPNDAQSTVMVHDGGPLWVIAGPGTGKTQALILRCLYLLCVKKIPPESLLLTTYTRKAAQQLQQRLQEALQQLHIFSPEVKQIDLTAMRVGTIHSICLDLLQTAVTSPFRHIHLLDEVERIFLVQANSSLCTSQAAKDAIYLDLLAWANQPDNPQPGQFLPTRWQRAQTFITLYQRLIEDQVDLQRFARVAPHLQVLVELVTEYREILNKRNFTDYTLIQQQTLEWLLSSEGQVFLKGTGHNMGIQYVIVDEYQDTNPLQAALYRAFASNPPHELCVVGDDDQALYRFRGGTVTCMVRFAHECQEEWPECQVRQVALTKTYRSHPQIVRWINAYVEAQAALRLPGARVHGKRSLAAMRSPLVPGPVVYAVRGSSAETTAEAFAQLIAELLDRQVIESPSQCALLAHSIKERTIGPYRSALNQKGIAVAFPPFVREHPMYQQAIGTLLTALDPIGLSLPTTHGDRQFATFLETCRESCQQDTALANLAHVLNTWLLRDSDARHQQSLSQLLEYILNSSTCNVFIEQDAEALMAAQTLRELVDAYDRIVGEGKAQIPFDIQQQTFAGWWSKLLYSILAPTLYEGLRSEPQETLTRTAPGSAMPVLTIHQSKGLEFPMVAVIVGDQRQRPESVHQLERAVLPYRRDLAGESDMQTILGGDDAMRAIQDKVRLHYVAYSRARDLLFLLTPDSRWKPAPAIGLGGERSWFTRYVREWPVLETSPRHNKNAQSSLEGAYQDDLWKGL